MFYGYCFPEENGWHTPKVRLDSPEEVWNYLQLQKQMFEEVRITDEDDFTVAHALRGKIVFPPEWADADEKIRKARKERMGG